MYNYLKESQIKLKSFEKNFMGIPIIVKEPFLSNIDIDLVLDTLKDLIPYELVKNLDSFYVGQFKHLNRRGLLASYDESVIYVNNIQPSQEKLIRAIIHEFAHVAEEEFGIDIYGDTSIKKEFLQKRMWLYEFLKSYYSDIPSIKEFVNCEYSEYFDAYLTEELGYDTLLINTANVFPSPYAITCLQEYFAVGFEIVFANNSQEVLFLKKICPILYDKLYQFKLSLQGE